MVHCVDTVYYEAVQSIDTAEHNIRIKYTQLIYVKME